MKSTDHFNEEVLKINRAWASATESVVERVIRRRKLKVSRPDKKNIDIIVYRRGDDVVNDFVFRNALRYVDMGAGRGYMKGKRITDASTAKRSYYKVGKTFKKYKTKLSARGRRAKKIITRPIYARIHELQEVMGVTMGDEILVAIRNTIG